ncbi:hypothetical protein [Hyphomonas sp.]|uniref:hypothetical protein n=1 Tax=Hyphomonas sp. TaxID=87 RepID=UPI0035684029
MVLKRVILGAACLFASGMASAENARGEFDMPLLKNIQQTVCAGDSEIVFVPVSHDLSTFRTTYAVIALSNPDPDSANIVSERERLWLNVNGCNEPRIEAVHASGELNSGGFNF